MAHKEPAPISLSKDRSEPAKHFVKPVEPFNKSAPESEEKPPIIVKKVVKDKALERRVATLESDDKEINVTIEAAPRARIASITIKYDNFGNPVQLVPQYDG